MKKFDAWYFPNDEAHLTGWMQTRQHRVDGRLTYQFHKYEAAIKSCTQRRTAVDAGAHIGLMSYWMARDFQSVHAFEPMQQMVECWLENVQATNAEMHPFALGKERGAVRMAYDPADTGGTHISASGDGQRVEVRALDEFRLQHVDFLKVDCEGAELAVLQGAEQTILRCRPCIMVEQKARILAANYGVTGTPAVDYLIALGARQRKEISGDFILTFPC